MKSGICSHITNSSEMELRKHLSISEYYYSCRTYTFLLKMTNLYKYKFNAKKKKTYAKGRPIS